MLFSRVCACVPACARAGVFMTSMILLGARWYLRRRWHLALTLTKADSIKLELNVMGLGSRGDCDISWNGGPGLERVRV